MNDTICSTVSCEVDARLEMLKLDYLRPLLDTQEYKTQYGLPGH